jgi:large subunit ribosomal protein L9
MELILRADVDNLGRLGEVVRVKPGYGRNYLIPQGLAMPATAANQKIFEQERKKLQVRMDQVKGAAQAAADQLSGKEIVLRVRTGEADRLYGSVTSANIVDALAGQGIELDKRKLDLGEPIRALGRYEIPVRLHPDVQAFVTVLVVRHDWEPGQEIVAAGAEAAAAAPEAGGSPEHVAGAEEESAEG